MTGRNNTNNNSDMEAKTELAQWMIRLLLSDDRPQEDALDQIRLYLADDKDRDLKRDVLDELFLEAFESRPGGAHIARAARAEQMWPRIAYALGMDPDLRRYRTILNPEAAAKPLRRPLWRRAALRVAAVMLPVMIVVTAVLMWLESYADPSLQPVVANVAVSVPEGGQKRIVLPDGSQVWVNSSTTLCYNDDFSKERSVALDGEAFFSVVRDTLTPFRVRTADMAIQVLGTEFNVNTLRGAPTAEVVLVSGSVKVETPAGKAIELTPGDRLTFDAESSSAVIDRIADTTVARWRVTDLRMEQMPLVEALERIAAYYGLDLSIVGALPAGDLVNFTPMDQLPVDQLLDVVQAISASFDYQLTEHSIIILPR